jgi:hypothetical protein
MLDELRKDDDSFDFEEDVSLESDEPEVRHERLFLGMTAVERMFIAIFLFLNVVILGLAFLLATGRIAF